MGEHIRRALWAPSPLAQDAPLPATTRRAGDFPRDSKSRDVANFWGNQLSRLNQMALGSDSPPCNLGRRNITWNPVGGWMAASRIH